MKSLYLFLLITSAALGQSIGSYLPGKISKTGNYVFYLHGQIVTDLGDNAVSQAAPEWGPYEYSNILDTLRKNGFHVISERRKKGVPDSKYVDKIAGQVDTLLHHGVAPRQILVLGASAGWNVGIRVSDKLKNKDLRFVIMGGCWPETYKQYVDLNLYGHFLSIIESTDPHGTCTKIFDGRKTLSSFREITLNTGRSHGFIYKGYPEWVKPVVDWFTK